MTDPVVRNRRITLGYHRMARALATRLGPGGEGNWCAFATWASRRAGRTIRGEDLRYRIEELLEASPELSAALEATVITARRLGSGRTVEELRSELCRLVDLERAVGRTAAAVARGNRLVFEDVGSAVAGFLNWHPEEAPDQAGVAGPGRPELRGGDPPEGQRYLRSALDRFLEFESETDPKRRAELLLLANVEIGYHEQVRVHPDIGDAMNAAIPEPAVLRDRVISFLFPGAGIWRGMRMLLWSFLGRRPPLDRALDRLVENLRAHLRTLVTSHLMALELPGGRSLSLGDDIDGPFPETLDHLEHPELVELLARIDPTPDSLEGTGARDWGDLAQRVHFIVDLFRRYQETPGLLRPPYPASPHSASEVDSA